MNPLFTIFIDVYWGLDLFKESLSRIRSQTYDNLEIIISNNGSGEEIKNLIKESSEKDKRIKVINYKDNIFSYKDPALTWALLCNDALKIAEGEFIFYQSYDDLMCVDYVERMVKLFDENALCSSAAGLPVSLDIKGNIAEEEITNRTSNLRQRYMEGHKMVLDYLDPEKSKVFSAPGTIFTFRKETLKKYGGFHRSIESSQLYGIVPFGITGFDEEAIFYWRRHEGQLNKELIKHGHCGVKEFYSMLNDFNVQKNWEVFGEETAKLVVGEASKRINEHAASLTAINLLNLNLRGAIKIMMDCFWKENYLYYLLKHLWENKILLVISFINLFKFILKPLTNLIIKILPINLSQSNKLSRLHKFLNKKIIK